MTPAGATAFAYRRGEKSAVYAYEQEGSAELPAQELGRFILKGGAWTFFEATPPSYKKVLLHWVTTARKAETRLSRFATLLEACKVGKRLR